MVTNAEIENSEKQNYNEEQIKWLAAFFADRCYHSPANEHSEIYNNEEWIVVKELHKNKIGESGFDGSIYFNTTTHKFIVAFRGTEFGLDNEAYRDFIRADVLEFGYNRQPRQYTDAKSLLDDAITHLQSQ